MIKLLTGGGLGDAAMSYAKLYSPYAPFANKPIEDLHVTHVEVPGNLIPTIEKFYKSQNINTDVFKIDSWQWLSDNISKYDYYLGTHWSRENVGDPDSWEIEPFPPIVFDKIRTFKTVLCPSSGRSSNRKFSKDDILKFDFDDLVYIGTGDKENLEFFDGLSGISFLNKTDLWQAIDIICGCDIFIGQSGFLSFLAAMAKKKVYMVSEGQSSIYRVHPKWDVTYINNLSEVSI